MKQNPAPETDEPLRGLLRQWKVETPLPPRFQEQVWERIARAEARPASARGHWFGRWLESILPQPKWAVAYLAVLLGFGMAAGSVTAQIMTSHLETNLSTRYVQSVSPYQTEVPRP